MQPTAQQPSPRGIFDSEGFVLPEAVELDLPAASLPLRIVSGLIDLMVTLLWALLLAWLEPWALVSGDAALLQAMVIVVTVGVLVALPVTLETLLRGRTVGKLVLGLRTVRDDVGPIGLRHALIRALAGVIELWLTTGGLALLVAATNERAKRLGDMLAGTYVVQARSRLRLPPPPGMPPHLAGWAVRADIGVLPDGLAMAVRQFLARAHGLAPAARAGTGSVLLSEVLARVSPPPPPAHPEDVLAAVLAERSRRERERVAARESLRARLLPPDPLARPAGETAPPGPAQPPGSASTP